MVLQGFYINRSSSLLSRTRYSSLYVTTSAVVGAVATPVDAILFWADRLNQILHHSRVMPLVGGHRYLPSTAVFLCEVLKLTICTTLALYDMSRTIAPSMPATSLFSGLVAAVFTGDSWKLAIPAR